MSASKNPTELTKELFGKDFFKDMTKKLAEASENDISREAEKLTNQLNLALSQLVMSRLPIMQRMLDFLQKIEDTMFSDEVFELCHAKFYDKDGNQIEVYNEERRKLNTVYDIALLHSFYEKVNKDFLSVLEFIRKYTSRIPMDKESEMTPREKEIQRVLSNMSEDELADLSRVLIERKMLKK